MQDFFKVYNNSAILGRALQFHVTIFWLKRAFFTDVLNIDYSILLQISGELDKASLNKPAIACNNNSDTFHLKSPFTQEHINHARIANVLMTVCADALRDILLCQVPAGYSNIYAAIIGHKQLLTGMKKLKHDQLTLLFPDQQMNSTGTVDQFGISLLYTLIRNVSTVYQPVTGWGCVPLDHPWDDSIGANVERIRLIRNVVSGHSMDGKLDDVMFEYYWNQINATIASIEKSIGSRGYIEALQIHKTQPVTIEEIDKLRFKLKGKLL